MKKSIACILIWLLLSGLAGCAQVSPAAPELLEPAGIKLDTAVVTRGDIYRAVIYNGEVVPYVENLSFAADGRLGEVHVRVGDLVQKGQVLVSLDVTQMETQITNLRDEIAHAYQVGAYQDRLAELDIAVAQEQLKLLRQSGAAVGQCREKSLEIEQLTLNLQQSRELRQMELGQKEARLEKLTKQLSGTTITAPISGRVVYVTAAAPGSTLRAYSTVIGIADESRLCISTEFISEQKINNAERIYAKILGADVPLVYVPMDGQEYVSKVVAGEKITSEFVVETAFEDLRSGQYAAVVLVNGYKEDVLTIPANAVYRDEKGRYVYKVEGDTRVRCNITVGLLNDLEAEILEGLQEGDVVYVKE